MRPQDSWILMVDDNPSNLKVLRGILSAVGYRLTFATRGKQVMERLHAVKPDLILLDLMMPDMDGLQVCKAIKQQSELADIPIIFLTASHNLDHLLQAFEQGAVDYLTKPFNAPELLARVKTHLELHHLRQQTQRLIRREIMLRQTIEDIHNARNLQAILDTVVSNIQQYLQANQVMICRCLPPDCQETVNVAWANSTLPPEPDENPDDANQPGWVQAPQPGTGCSPGLQAIPVSPDPASALSHPPLHQPRPINTEIQAPIWYQQTLWGLLVAYQEKSSQPWGSHEEAVLQLLSDPLAIAIQQHELHQELERLVNLDGLTQVANRRCFDQYLAQEWRRLRREQQPLTLLLFDIDFFKQYNDTYGHLAGDACLQTVALVLAQALKRPADLMARYGGEEFAAILPNTLLEGGMALAQQVQTAIANLQIPHATHGFSPYLTLSTGVATVIPTDPLTPDQLIDQVDQALYQAKHRGRNQYVAATNRLDAISNEGPGIGNRDQFGSRV